MLNKVAKPIQYCLHLRTKEKLNNYQFLAGWTSAFKDGGSFCYCAYILSTLGWSEKLGVDNGWYLLMQRYFSMAYDLSKGCWNLKRKLE